MKKNKLFLVISILFFLSVIGFIAFMASKTRAPWNKEKNNPQGSIK